MRRRRKLKRKVKITLIILLILLILLFIYIFLNNKKTEPKQDNLINDILSYNLEEPINKEFLEWVNKNYKEESLIKLNKYLKNNPYNQNIWHTITGNSLTVLEDLYKDKYKNMYNIKIIETKEITINFIGDVSFAEDWYIMNKYDERNKGIEGILSEEVIKELKEATISIANNEFTVSKTGTKTPGKLYHFKANPERLSLYNDMGIDLVTLANNHVYDYGEEAFNNMLNSLDEYKIPHIGAGRNLKEASKPYYFIINGYKIAFVNANRSEKNIKTPGATDTSSGVLRCYDPEIFTNLIKETKEESDFVIALIHWGKEDYHDLEQVQIDTSKTYIDAGADLIVGTHAHVLQGIDFYNGKGIIYNLGDFIFNNEDKDTMIYKLIVDNEGNFNHYVIPAHQKDEYTYLLKDNERKKVINNIISYSDNKINIDNDGKVTKAS